MVTGESYNARMSSTIHLPADVHARLRAEADRRGISLDALIVDLAAQFPDQRHGVGGADDSPVPEPSEAAERSSHRLRFVGMGRSGSSEPIDIHRERARLAEKKLAEGI